MRIGSVPPLPPGVVTLNGARNEPLELTTEALSNMHRAHGKLRQSVPSPSFRASRVVPEALCFTRATRDKLGRPGGPGGPYPCLACEPLEGLLAVFRSVPRCAREGSADRVSCPSLRASAGGASLSPPPPMSRYPAGEPGSDPPGAVRKLQRRLPFGTKTARPGAAGRSRRESAKHRSDLRPR